MVLVITAVENFYSGQFFISTDRDGPVNQGWNWGEIGVKLKILTRKVRVKLEITVLEIGLADESEFIL